jgi:teichuronic acid biosynthesis glycosyltransferase TuaG
MSLTDPASAPSRRNAVPAPDSPSVSVVIPHYNSTASLGRALAGAAAQTLLPLEVIIVDDCSAPEELGALRALDFTGLPFPVRVLEQERNHGPATARNRGWDAARGDWIAFLDSDDSWHPRRLGLQMGALTPATLMISADSVELSGGAKAPRPLDSVGPERLRMRHHLVRNPHTTSSVLLRRDLPLRFTTGRSFAEDYELWIRIAALGEVLTLPTPLAYFHKAQFGTSGLSSRIWKMVAGEHETFVLLRHDGVISGPQFFLAESIMLGRIARRLALRTLRNVRRQGG